MQSKKSPIQFDVAKLLDIDFPDECLPGIEANLQLLQYHARILDAYIARLNTAALATRVP
ncbi:MAG: hypothetical protein ABL921_23060 [Pirellula sp.]